MGIRRDSNAMKTIKLILVSACLLFAQPWRALPSGVSTASITPGTCAIQGSALVCRNPFGNLTFTLASGGGSGTVSSISINSVNGISGTVDNPTTTPALNLLLGDITPNSVNSSDVITSAVSVSAPDIYVQNYGGNNYVGVAQYNGKIIPSTPMTNTAHIIIAPTASDFNALIDKMVGNGLMAAP